MVNWFSKFIKRKRCAPEQKPDAGSPAPAGSRQGCGMEELKKLFEGDETLMTREFLCGGRQCCIAFINGMTHAELMDRHIIEPLMKAEFPTGADPIRHLLDTVIPTGDAKYLTAVGDITLEVIEGNTALFIENIDGALAFNTKKWTTRSVDEPESEKVSRGPREGFNESLNINLSLIRRKLCTPDLKIKFRKTGKRSNTKVCILYLQELADQAVLDELNRRLDAIDIDAALAINYIDELIRDSPASMFLTMGTTERPDVVASKLLEGRVAVMMEGTPTALTLPYVFIEYFQQPEDYYGNFWLSSIARMVRIIGFVLTVTISSFYLAMVTIHQEMVPTNLLLAINASRQQVPLPAVLELILMLIVIEIMRESGARVPSFIGQSLSIVGGLVIGQAAVAARLISAPIIIVIALSAISSMLVPKIEGAAFLVRIGLVIITSVLGFYGMMIGLTAMILHLVGIRSFGVPYLSNVLPMKMQEFKDTAIRMPWYLMVLRPRHISAKDSVRQSGRKI